MECAERERNEMKSCCRSDVKTMLLSGLLTFFVVGYTQFPDTFDIAAVKRAPCVKDTQAIAAPDIAPGAAN